MTWWDRFLADAVPTAVMGGIALAALAASWLAVFMAGVGWGRRDAWRAVAAMRAGFEQQIELTVPLLSACAREEQR